MKLSEPYIRRKIDGRRRSIHRVVIEQILGRKLTPDECVHHINEDTRDNRPENLQVMTRAEHAALHSSGRQASLETRQKMSVSRIGNQNSLGFKHSESTLRRRSEARKGKPLPDATKTRMKEARQKRLKTYVLQSPQGNLIEVRGLNEFCKQNGISLSGLGNVMSGRASHCKQWKVLEVRNGD